jgi:acyl-CoA synthetase (AMP-forming)/AMP-acid ligase II/acyl carrier protein
VLLTRALVERRATLMQATPATWRLLLAAGWTGDVTFRICCGGEALPPDLAQALQRCGRDLWNLYGPTETTIWSIATRLDQIGHCVPIGRPIANTTVYVLDAQQQPVPIGVAGELYIGGVGIARGYLNQPDLTAERFVPNPFALEDGGWRMEDGELPSSILHPPSSRLYKTGDLARYRPDRAIEFLGRTDQQVKLRGFRIELGEIEAALTQHPAVSAAAVLARPDAAGELRLVAYLVSKLEDSGSKIEDSRSDAPEPLSSTLDPLFAELRRFLRGKLPDYMVPAAFMLLDTLPLTPNGKLDRKALPNPTVVPTTQVYAPPQSRLEGDIAAIWQKVLGVEQVGRDSNFFDLGGHSLRMVQVQSLLRETLGQEVSMLELFTYPTVSALAQQLGGQPGGLELFTETIQQVEARSESARRRRELQKTSWSTEAQKGERHA